MDSWALVWMVHAQTSRLPPEWRLRTSSSWICGPQLGGQRQPLNEPSSTTHLNYGVLARTASLFIATTWLERGCSRALAGPPNSGKIALRGSSVLSSARRASVVLVGFRAPQTVRDSVDFRQVDSRSECCHPNDELMPSEVFHIL